MAHFAKLNQDNIVIAVHCVSNDALESSNEELSGIDFLTSLHNYSHWKQTSYNGKFRKQFAGIGFKYDEQKDIFIAPQPYLSWILDNNFDWQAPKPRPEGFNWYWDEELGEWINAETV